MVKIYIYCNEKLYFCGNTKQKNDVYNYLVGRYQSYLETKYFIFGEMNGKLFKYDKNQYYDSITIYKKQ